MSHAGYNMMGAHYQQLISCRFCSTAIYPCDVGNLVQQVCQRCIDMNSDTEMDTTLDWGHVEDFFETDSETGSLEEPDMEVEALLPDVPPRERVTFVTGQHHASETNMTCAICLTTFGEDPDPVARLSCHPAHVFHAKCVKSWVVDQSKPCPLCRR